MTLKQFLDCITCWDGGIVLNDRNFSEIARGYFCSSLSPYIDDEEDIDKHFKDLIGYLDCEVVCFTPCYNPNTCRIWLEIMIDCEGSEEYAKETTKDISVQA